MNPWFSNLLEAARLAKERGNLSDTVKLLILGGCLFASEADAISNSEYEQMVEIVGEDFCRCHAEALVIAASGESDADVDARIAREKFGLPAEEVAA